MFSSNNWINIKSYIVEHDILKVEDFFNEHFPQDFKDFIISYNGAEPIRNKIRFGDCEEEVLKSLLSFSKNDESYIITIFKECAAFLENGLIPIAQTHYIDLICFDFRTDSKSPNIVYWNYELSAIGEDDSIYFICSNFSQLLKSLK